MNRSYRQSSILDCVQQSFGNCPGEFRNFWEFHMFEGLPPTGGSTSFRGRLWFWGMLLILLTAVSASYRLGTNRHFGRMYVRLPESVAGSEFVYAFTRGVDGALVPLTLRNKELRLYGRASDWTQVTSVVLAGSEPKSFDAETAEVFIGAGVKHSQRLGLREIRSMSMDDAVIGGQRRQYGLTWAVEIVPFPASRSWIPGNAMVVNWQGDVMLLLLAATQGIAGTAFVAYLVWAARRISGVKLRRQPSDGIVGEVMRLTFELIRLTILILVLHLCWCCFWTLATVREAPQFIGGMLAAGITVSLLWAWNLMVDRAKCARQMSRRMLALTVGMLMLKLLWLSSVEVRPKMPDYDYFYRSGFQLANLDWDGIANGPKGIAAIYLRRAVTFAWPTSLFFGGSITAYENVNLFVQAVTIWMFCVFVRRMFGWKVSARALAVLLVHPEYWCLPGIITHNIVGYFWLLGSFLTIDTFLRSSAIDRMRGRSVSRRLMSGLMYGICAGACTGMLELSKSYGVLILTAIVLCLPAGCIWEYLKPTRRRLYGFGLSMLVFLPALLTTYQTLTKSVDSFLLNRTALRVPENWSTNTIATIESSGSGSGDREFVWAIQYAGRIPEDNYFPVTLRKIIHEKLGESDDLLLRVFRKNEDLSMACDVLIQAQDDLSPPNESARLENIFFGTVQHTLSYSIMLLIGSTSALRLLSDTPLLWSKSEFIPAMTLGFTMIAVYFMIASHAYYALNFLFPFACSAGMITEKLRSVVAPGSFSNADLMRTLLPARRVSALVILAMAVYAFVRLGESVDGSNLTFHRVQRWSGEQQVASDGDSFVEKAERIFEAGVSRVHGWIEFPLERGIIKQGDVATQTFEVISQSGSLRGLSFFLSGNQRFRQHSLPTRWNDLPLVYSISIGGKSLVHDRPISELRTPRFVSIPRDFWLAEGESANRVLVTVEMRCERDAAIGKLTLPPAIAVEYLH